MLVEDKVCSGWNFQCCYRFVHKSLFLLCVVAFWCVVTVLSMQITLMVRVYCGFSAKCDDIATLKAHQTDHAGAKEAMAKSTAMRKKVFAACTKETGDLKYNIGALNKVSRRLKRVCLVALLQTTSASMARALSISMDKSSDCDLLRSSLCVGDSTS